MAKNRCSTINYDSMKCEKQASAGLVCLDNYLHHNLNKPHDHTRFNSFGEANDRL